MVLTRAVKDPQPGNHPAAAPRGRSRDARSETMVCTRLHRCVCQGRGGQRAKRGVGSCWKTRLPNTKHTEGSCVRPGHLTTPTGAPGSSEAAESSSPGPPHRPPTCRGLRSDGGFLGHSLLNVNHSSGTVSALPAPAIWTQHTEPPASPCRSAPQGAGAHSGYHLHGGLGPECRLTAPRKGRLSRPGQSGSQHGWLSQHRLPAQQLTRMST